MNELAVRNRQRTRSVNTHRLRRIAHFLLVELLGLEGCVLGVHLVTAKEMARINETFLAHKGSTDVITFNLSGADTPGLICGEIYVCVEVAVRQAKQFDTSWPSEVVRYLVHGVLHLTGHDDCQSRKRAKMKREENRLVRELQQQFPFASLCRRSRAPRVTQRDKQRSRVSDANH